ncbi:NACHT and WD40 repeat domain-containing protein, partial [Actinocorallia lasiicapitis]
APPFLPPPGAGRYQVVRVGAQGLTRYVRSLDGEPVPEPETVQHPWEGGSATFAPEAEDRLTVPVPPPALPEDDGLRAATPARLLLNRVKEVCETRYERARIRLEPGDPPDLLVTHGTGEFVQQFRVAAHLGEITMADIDALYEKLHATGGEQSAELVYEGALPAPSLSGYALRRRIRLRSFLEFQGLLDFTDYVSRQTERLAADQRYPPGLYVDQRFRELEERTAPPRHDLLAELLNLLATDHGRFILVLGQFGHGKTFALRELARRLPAELPHLVPIFIELRALDKAHSVDGLVAAHLANHGKELSDLKAFHYMLREGRIVLLFDGFDELVARVTYDRAIQHLSRLVEVVDDKAKIIISSRTQFFRTESQVYTALGQRVRELPHRRVLVVEQFQEAQIRTYLVNQYGGDSAQADDRLELLAEVPGLLELAQNPRMLSFIARIDDDRLRAVAHGQANVTTAELYREVLTSWLTYEEQRTQGVPGSPLGLSVDDLWYSVTVLALRLWASGESYIRPAELTKVATTLATLATGGLTAEETAHAVGTGSLLVRTEDDLFGFIHSSVAEWLVAKHIADQFDVGVVAPPELSKRLLTSLIVKFLRDLAGDQVCQNWAEQVLREARTEEQSAARSNALQITNELRASRSMNLRGANLAGDDLSRRELQEVDLTKANLSEATLAGTDLTRAVLRQANLRGALLNRAILTGADLEGADLSKARLIRANLRGIRWRGSRWSRAALIDATLDSGLANVPELRGAAIAPGQPVDVEIRPAAIGVPYGFDEELGRLPEPVAYNFDGDLLVVGNEDGGILVCEGETGREIRTLIGHSGRVYTVVFGPDDRLLVTSASDGTVKLWDQANGRLLHRLPEHDRWAWPVLLSPDGSLLATGDGQGDVRLWNTFTGAPVHTLGGHHPPVYTAVFSEDGRVLATGDRSSESSPGRVRLWDVATGELLRTLDGHEGSVYRVAFRPSGPRAMEPLLATGDYAGSVRLWNPATGELEATLDPGRRKGASVYTMAFHPGNAMLAVGTTDGALQLWDSKEHRRLQALPDHGGAVYRVGFSPAGEVMASCDSEGAMRVWNPLSGQLLAEMTGHRGSVWPFAFHPSGTQLATSSNDGTVRLWDVTDRRAKRVLRGHGRRVTGVSFSADGEHLAASQNDGIVRVWDPVVGRLVHRLSGRSYQLTSAIFSLSGDRLATATNDGLLGLWNAKSGELERELSANTDHVWAEAFNHDGELLATANDDDLVCVWVRTSGRLWRTFTHPARVRSIAFSPDGELVATACDDHRVRLWDVDSGELRAALDGHTSRVHQVAFSADPGVFASASGDGTARVWDVRSGRSAQVLEGHQGGVWAVAFGPDADTVVTAGEDRVVRLWDPHGGGLRHELHGHTRRVLSVAVHPSGATLASGGDDGSVVLWDLTGAAPSRALTLLGLPDGWVAYAPDGRYKRVGEVAEQFWHAVGMVRFDPGELDRYLPELNQLAATTPF